MVGRIESHWTIENDIFNLSVTIPANTEGIVHLPTESSASVTEQGQPIDQVEDIYEIQQVNGAVILTIGSGHYQFRSQICHPAKTKESDNEQKQGTL
jgi:alpha-L-rhamnosidase